MFFSQTAEYALRAVVFLAQDSAERRTARDIADAMQIPVDYVSKVMQSLARAGLVEAQRGKLGGFRLTRPAHRVTLLEVVNAVDPVRRISSCPLGLRQHSRTLCPLHRKLDEAVASVERELLLTSVADLVEMPAAVAAAGVSHAG
jgi:Rrf2 family transcriptional regulator, nitric oxide-sensitive transcriptional repressor